MDEKKYPTVKDSDFCGRFERTETSLIEEQEECLVCCFFCDRDDTCRWPEAVQ